MLVFFGQETVQKYEFHDQLQASTLLWNERDVVEVFGFPRFHDLALSLVLPHARFQVLSLVVV